MLITFDSKLLSSCHINFLFGAGVNGKAFPQLNGFKKTNEFLSKQLGISVDDFEKSLDSLSEDKKREAIECFKEEFEKYANEIVFSSKSIKNIESMFVCFNNLVGKSENRTKTTKQVNIYSLNYDSIIEKVLQDNGFLVNVVSSTNIDNHNKFFNLIGYNSDIQTFVPTYLISKLHGDINNPILPGVEKYDQILMANKFEILFKMKEKLSRFNSVLFVIGYSGHDEHINRMINECVTCGLTVYWFKFSKDDKIPETLIGKVFDIENDGEDDTTDLCKRMVEKLWIKSLEE
ncbi:MAG: SIR2 family protein [Bacteroidales bacterium]